MASNPKNTKLPRKKRQSDDFKSVAKDIEADESGESFESAFGKIIPPILPTKKIG